MVFIGVPVRICEGPMCLSGFLRVLLWFCEGLSMSVRDPLTDPVKVSEGLRVSLSGSL